MRMHVSVREVLSFSGQQYILNNLVESGDKNNEADKVTWMEKTSWRDKKRETRLGFSLAVRTGLEPVTPCVTGMYSNQLN